MHRSEQKSVACLAATISAAKVAALLAASSPAALRASRPHLELGIYLHHGLQQVFLPDLSQHQPPICTDKARTGSGSSQE